jgi:hypothetical protein
LVSLALFGALRGSSSLLQAAARRLQVEYMLVVTVDGLQIPERKREFYAGTNRGNVISPVILRPLNEGWSATFREKKEIYGKHRRAVGGTNAIDGVDGDVAASSARPPTVDGLATGNVRPEEAEEPVFYKVLPPTFYRCLFSSMCAKGVVDCTAGDGSAALSAVEKKIPYFGVCLTEKHARGLLSFLVTSVLEKFLDEKSPLFQAKFAELKKPPKATVKPTAKPKKAKRTGSDEDDEEGRVSGGGGSAADEEEAPPKKKPRRGGKTKDGSGSDGSM